MDFLDSVISEKIKREKPSVDDYEHVREEVLALVQYSYTEKKAILIGLMKKNSANFPAFFYPMKRRESDSFLMLFLKLRGGINVYYKNNILPLCPIYIYYKNSKD